MSNFSGTLIAIDYSWNKLKKDIIELISIKLNRGNSSCVKNISQAGPMLDLVFLNIHEHACVFYYLLTNANIYPNLKTWLL